MDAFELLIKASEVSPYIPVDRPSDNGTIFNSLRGTESAAATAAVAPATVAADSVSERNRWRSGFSSDFDPIDSIMLLAEQASMKSPIRRSAGDDSLLPDNAATAAAAEHNFGPYFNSPQNMNFRRARAMSEPWVKLGSSSAAGWDDDYYYDYEDDEGNDDAISSPQAAASLFALRQQHHHQQQFMRQQQHQHQQQQHRLFRSHSFNTPLGEVGLGDTTLPQMLDQYAAIYNKNGRIGIYTKDERATIIERFREKRKRRVWKKKIRYNCRKNLADRRVRVKGRFVKAGSQLARELLAAEEAAAAREGGVAGGSSSSGSSSDSKGSPGGSSSASQHMDEDEEDEEEGEEDQGEDDDDFEYDRQPLPLRSSTATSSSATIGCASPSPAKRSKVDPSIAAAAASRREVKEYVVSSRSGSDMTYTSAESIDFTPRNTDEQLQQLAGGATSCIAAIAVSSSDAAVAKAAAAAADAFDSSSNHDDDVRLPSGKRMRRHSIAY